jgi:hypothetical protein
MTATVAPEYARDTPDRALDAAITNHDRPVFDPEASRWKCECGVELARTGYYADYTRHRRLIILGALGLTPEYGVKYSDSEHVDECATEHGARTFAATENNRARRRGDDCTTTVQTRYVTAWRPTA